MKYIPKGHEHKTRPLMIKICHAVYKLDLKQGILFNLRALPCPNVICQLGDPSSSWRSHDKNLISKRYGS